MMTGPGTNSYLVGDRALTVIDPGPVDHEHTQALLHAAEKIGRPIEQILVTHTHRDHSPGARELAEASGARLLGPDVPDDGLRTKPGPRNGACVTANGWIAAAPNWK
jgi:hydroxyacylglutathione hydrolase